MIDIKNLNKIYNENSSSPFHALKNINLEVKKGELLILKGISGSGKSTLLSIIATLIKPSSGELIVNGEQVARLPDLHTSRFRNEHLGFIPQSFNLFESLSVEQNVQIPMVPLKLSLEQTNMNTQTALKLANIGHKSEQTIKTLSGGEKQRCAIARALVNNPEIILCDEPTANLDKENSLKFVTIIKELQAMGKTIVVATHDSLFDELEFPFRLVCMEDGMIIA